MAPLLSQLESIALGAIRQSLAVRILITLLILVAGFGLSRVASRLVRWLWRRAGRNGDMPDKLRMRKRSPEMWAEYGTIVLTLAVAVVYINTSAANTIASRIAAYVPKVVTSILVFLLGVIVVRGFISAVRTLISNLEMKEHAETVGISPKVLEAFIGGIRVFLYLVVLELAVIQLGVSSRIISNTITAASYGVALLLALLGFFGFKDLVQNYAAGIYLRSSDVLKPGKRVKIDDEYGEIRDISALGTTVTTDSGYFMLTPNQNLMDKQIKFKRVQADVETLEDITDYFVYDSTSHRGAAASEMALAMFGFDISQGDISDSLSSEKPSPQELGQALEELTEEEVKSAFVEAEKVTELGTEFKVWFNNDALLLPYFSRDVLFPGSDSTDYVLSVAVEGDELLVMDSGRGESGGVYYVDSAEMQGAMEDAEGGGYLVVAPRGTTAFWRIKKDLIYSSLSLYRQLSKNLEVQLNKIIRRGEVLKQVVPEVVDDFIERWQVEGEEGTVTQMWKPEGGGDKKIDEFTGDS